MFQIDEVNTLKYGEDQKKVITVFPNSGVILGANRNICCNVGDCRRRFAVVGGLLRHWSFEHFNKRNGYSLRFHCPEEDCCYHSSSDNNTKYFTNMKLLRQHYLIKHGEATHTCDKCGLKFSLQRLLVAHLPTCGMNFACGSCDMTYPCRTSLLTHCHRARHTLPKKYRTAKSKIYDATPPAKTLVINLLQIKHDAQANFLTSELDTKEKLRPLLPKPTVIKRLTSSSMNKQKPVACSRTDVLPLFKVDRPQSNVLQKDSNSNMSVGLQVGAPRLQTKVGTATQTSGEYVLKTAMQSASIPVCHSHKGSQVSPRAKTKKACKRYQSSDGRCQSSKRKHQLTQIDTVHSSKIKIPRSSTSTDTSTINLYSDCADLDLLSSTDIQTQTMSLMQDLEDCLASTISTQTFDSFLLERNQTIQQTAETQTALRHVANSFIQTDLPFGSEEFVSSSPSLNAFQDDISLNHTTETSFSLSMSPIEPNSRENCSDLVEILQSMGTQTIDFDSDNFLHNPSASVSLTNTETQTVDLLEQFLRNMETQTPITDFAFFNACSNSMGHDTCTGTREFASTSTQAYGTSAYDPVALMDLDATSASTQTVLRMPVHPNTQATNTETQTILDDFNDMLVNTFSTWTQTLENNADTETQT